MIGWNLRATFFQRRSGWSRWSPTTAAGRQGYQVRDIEPETALGVVGAVTPDLLAQFSSDPAPADAV